MRSCALQLAHPSQQCVSVLFASDTMADSVASQVLNQYDLAHARTFYRYVMGGGTANIHYGIFR
jgi:hypothetical protein